MIKNKENKTEKDVRYFISWIVLFVASVCYFGVMQFILDIPTKKMGINLILIGIWGFGYMYIVENVIKRRKI